MRYKKLFKYTINTYLYNKLYKRYLKERGLITCVFCRYHKNENKKGGYFSNKRNWKKYRNKQYKGIKIYG